MKYFFAPGRITELSVAELKVVAQTFLDTQYTIEQAEGLLILHTGTSKQVLDRLFSRLGGFIKYGLLIEDLDTFLDKFSDRKKVVFGVSAEGNAAGKWTQDSIKELSENIKRSFKEKGISGRYILPREHILNAGQVLKNNLLEKGFELTIFETGKTTYYGQTYAVQNIDMFSLLDYGKPFTDKKMGVLPTKLAKILVNLAGVKEGATIWDPFCGSGTVLLEGLMNGYNVIGSDNDDKAVQFSKDNISWLAGQNILGDRKFDIFNFDVLKPDPKILKDLKYTQIDAIVCEPFMGPPQFRIMSQIRANELSQQVAELYKGLLDVIDETRKYGIKLVIVVPSFKTDRGWTTVSINEVAGKKWEIENKKYGGDLHWERPNSIIRRNIFILSRK